MSVDVDIDLPSLAQAKLRSERIRILCMMGLFAAFLLLGLFRIVVPLNGTPSVGWIVFGISFAYLAFEALMFRAVARRLETQRPLSRWLSAMHGASECLYPIVTLYFPDAARPGRSVHTARFTRLRVSVGFDRRFCAPRGLASNGTYRGGRHIRIRRACYVRLAWWQSRHGESASSLPCTRISR